MKNKLKKTMTALCAALILMGGFSVPAYAQGAATEPPAGDATNDSNVVVEEKEETPPLTPKGNATLVDDYGGNKQLITVTTKGGNYFYILIDRAAEGEQTVHFLNQVDEADLMALTENGEAAKKPEICNCTEKCEAGKVNTSCPVCVTSMTGCTGKEPTPTPTEQPEEPKGKGGNPGVVLALVLFALLGGGAAFYYFKFLKPKQNVKGDTDLEDFEFEDYDEDEPEEETPDAPRASGSSFDEIDDAVRTAKNPEATTTERERAAKVFTDMEGTELYEKLMTGSSEMSIRIKGLIEIRLKKPKKDFVVPDNIEDFDIRNYV